MVEREHKEVWCREWDGVGMTISVPGMLSEVPAPLRFSRRKICNQQLSSITRPSDPCRVRTRTFWKRNHQEREATNPESFGDVPFVVRGISSKSCQRTPFTEFSNRGE